MSAERTLHQIQKPRDRSYSGTGIDRCGAHRRMALRGNIHAPEERAEIRELFNGKVVKAVRTIMIEINGREHTPAKGKDGRYILAVEDPSLRHHHAESLVSDSLEYHGWLPALEEMAYGLGSKELQLSDEAKKSPEDARAVCRLQALEMIEGAMKDIPAIEDRDKRQKTAIAIAATALPCPGWLGVLEKICGEMEAIGPFQAMLGRDIRAYATKISDALPEFGRIITFDANQTWWARHCKGND